MKRVIYYFTGTGNSMRAAVRIAEKLGNTEIISMRCDPADVPAEDCDLIGFIYPVYHWTMPAPAVSFVRKLKINPDAYIFALAMPSFVCGFACEKLAEVLAEKDAVISYGNMVHSVANYAIVYPPFPSAKIMVPQAEKKLGRIAEDISLRKERPYPRAGRLTRARRDKVMTPYLELQKYADNPVTISDECVGCGLCAKVCPCHNSRMEEGKPVFTHHCANCMSCFVCCPKRAIGYDITANDRKLYEADLKKVPIVRLMGLPEKRKLYRNPYITVKDLLKDRETFI